MHVDLLLTGGDVCDGSGAEPRVADVAVADGVVVAVGDCAGTTAEEVADVSGLLVMPGIVDSHTHLDAQLGWDASGSPCVEHGVTTAVMGNCGFGVAPCPPGGKEYLLRSLEAVEEIPYESTSAGLDVTWDDFGTWLDRLAEVPLGINVASFVPHSALRFAVMGDAARERAATPEERARLREALAAALAAGGLGLATSRGPNHRDGLGGPVPSRLADDDELADLVGACTGRIWQINVESKFGAPGLFPELDLYRRWTEAAGARLTWTPCFADPDGAWEGVLERIPADDAVVRPQICVQPLAGSLPFDRPGLLSLMGGWADALAGLGGDGEPWVDGLRARLSDPDVRAALRAAPVGGDGMLDVRYDEWMVVASPGDPSLVGGSIAALAADRNVAPSDLVCDLALADPAGVVVTATILNRSAEGREALLRSPATLVGLGDAGAHVRTITNFTGPTTFLADAAAGRTVPVAEAVRRLTSDPADTFGLPGVGRLQVGAPADIAVADLGTLAPGRAEVVADLPAGASRLWCGATGWERVVVGGRTVRRRGEPTGARPGRVLRP